MEISVTARRFELTDAVRDHVIDKLEKLERYDDGLIDAEVILSVEKHRHDAEILLHGSRSFHAAVHAEADDMLEAVDRATQKLERLVKRHREKGKSVRRRKGARAKAVVHGAALAVPPDEDSETEADSGV